MPVLHAICDWQNYVQVRAYNDQSIRYTLRSYLDINKPNGQYQLEANVNVILNFIRNLPIRKVHEKIRMILIECFDSDKRYW